MANEANKDFNAMLREARDMPRIQIVTDEKTIAKYGGSRMFFAPPAQYDAIMKRVPFGKLLTVAQIRDYLARQNGADFTEPLTAGIFVSIAAWASFQRAQDETPKYPGGVAAQREKLEAEGHSIEEKGRTNKRYFVRDYERALLPLDGNEPLRF